MKTKQKATFLTLLPAILGGFSLNAAAITNIQPNLPIGATYNFIADSLQYGFSSLSLDKNDASGSINLDPYISQNATTNFTMANPGVSGQFTYNNTAPLISTYTDATFSSALYNANTQTLTFNLNSENNIPGQALTTQNTQSVFTIPPGTSTTFPNGIQSFGLQSYNSTNPGITLTGDSFCCGIEVYGYQPQVGISNGDYLPDFFSDIESLDFTIYPSSNLNYKLSQTSLSVLYDGNTTLPSDNALPTTLPQNLTSGSVSLLFTPDGLTPLIEASIGMINFTADSPFYTNPYEYAPDCNMYYPGCGDLNYLSEKETLLNEFFNTNMDLSGYASIVYRISELNALNDGLTPETPLLPEPDLDPNDGIFNFSFTPNPNGFTFIDPYVAVGYDYQITSGNNFFTDVLLPTGYGDNLFELWLFDNTLNDFVDTGTILTGGTPYTFGSNVDLFRITGIETGAMLDPNDANAFVTGFQFFDSNVPTSVSQTALQQFVPEPSTIVLLLSGITFLATRKRKT